MTAPLADRVAARQMRREGHTQTEIAERFGVCQYTARVWTASVKRGVKPHTAPVVSSMADMDKLWRVSK